MKKHFIAAVFAFTLVLCSCTDNNSAENEAVSSEEVTETLSETSAADETTEPTVESQFRYQEFLSNVYLESYIGKETVVMIPTEINGKPVTGYAAGLFNNTNVREVIFPEGMTKLPYLITTDYITKIVIPSTIEELSAKDLMYIYYLDSIEVADGGNFIADDGVLFTADRKTIVYTFGCDEEYVVPEGVETLGEYSFSHHTFRSVSLPSTLKTIGKCTFEGCNRISYMEIPSSVTEIGESAFYSTGLVDIKLNEGIESIGAKAFQKTKLSEILLPQSIKEIGEYFVRSDCKVTAYEPLTELWDYDVTFLNKPTAENIERFVPEIPHYIDGMFFLDINFDGVPERFDFSDGYVRLYTLNEKYRWDFLVTFDSRLLYHYYDKEKERDFYAVFRSRDGDGAGFAVHILDPLENDINSECIGSIWNFGGLEWGSINGKFYMKEHPDYSTIDYDAYIRDSMNEYELVEVINFSKFAEEQGADEKFCIKLDPIVKHSSAPLMTYDEYTAENNVMVNDISYSLYDSEFLVYNENELEELSKFPNVTELSVCYTLENAEILKKFKNLKILYLCGIKDPSSLSELDGIEVLFLPDMDNYDFLSEMDSVQLIKFNQTIDKPDDFFKCLNGMKSLKYLYVDNYCDIMITDGQTEWLRENLPDLKVVYMF